MEKPQPRVLPFKKRAIKLPTSDQTADKDKDKDKTANDDSISMFRKRQDAKYFADIERKAAEKKAAKNVAVKGPPAVKQLKQKTSSSGKKSTSAHKEVRQGSKRQHLILSDDDDDTLPNSPSRKSPRDSKKKSTGRTRDFLKKARLSSDSPRPSRRGETPQGIISLSSDDDSVNATPTKPRNKGKGKERAIESSPTNGTGLPPSARSPLSSDRPELQFGTDPVEFSDDGDDDIGAAYIRSAQERAKQRKADQEAQEGREVQVVDIIIVSKLDGLDIVKIKTEVTRQTEMIKKAWQAKSIQKLDTMSSTSIAPATIESMFLTWRGVKLSDALTLERQGMTSLDSRGNFINAKTEHAGSRPGFQGSDKILFEAWTTELFEKHRLAELKQRRRAMGDFDDESESEGEPEPQPQEIRISLKSKDFEPVGMTVRPTTTIDGCIKAFRKLANKQKELPAEKIVQIVFDGEKLPGSSTIDDAGIEDMDALEVHIKDT